MRGQERVSAVSEGFGLRGRVEVQAEMPWERRRLEAAYREPVAAASQGAVSRDDAVGRGLSPQGWALRVILSVPALMVVMIPAQMQFTGVLYALKEKYPGFPQGVPPSEVLGPSFKFFATMAVLSLIHQAYVAVQFSNRMYDAGLSRGAGYLIYIAALIAIPVLVLSGNVVLFLTVPWLVPLALFVWGCLAPRTT